MKFHYAGSSHGDMLVGILEGMPSRMRLDREQIANQMHLRRLGYLRSARMNLEDDEVVIHSGVRGGVTTGAPIAFTIANRDYLNHAVKTDVWHGVGENIIVPRPGHADYAGAIKTDNDIFDVIESASARHTAAIVAAGAISRQLLSRLGIHVAAFACAVGGIRAKDEFPHPNDILMRRESDFGLIDQSVKDEVTEKADEAASQGDTLGVRVRCMIGNLGVGFGSYAQRRRAIDSRLAGAVMSLPAVKSVEFGMGDASADICGSRYHDVLDEGMRHKTNNAGGIEGGMSNGEDVIVTCAFKPIPTLRNGLKTRDIYGQVNRSRYIRSDTMIAHSACILTENAVALEMASIIMDELGEGNIDVIASRYEERREVRWKK